MSSRPVTHGKPRIAGRAARRESSVRAKRPSHKGQARVGRPASDCHRLADSEREHQCAIHPGHDFRGQHGDETTEVLLRERENVVQVRSASRRQPVLGADDDFARDVANSPR